MKITQVEPQKKNPHRFNVFLDGQFAFGADEDLVVEYRLVSGKVIENKDLDKLLFATEVGRLMERMYILWNIRPRSEKEVRDYLRNLSYKRKLKGQAELSPITIESLIEKLKVKGMVQDLTFAYSWVEARRRSKKKGKIALKQELFQKGIDKEIIEEVLSPKSSVISEEQLAKEALEKKLKLWRNLEPMEFKKKAYEFLLRKGFEYSVVKDVVANFLKSG